MTASHDRLQDIVRNSVHPLPRYELVNCTLERRPVIAMRVEPGDDWPYGVTSRGIRYYVPWGDQLAGAT